LGLSLLVGGFDVKEGNIADVADVVEGPEPRPRPRPVLRADMMI